MIREGAADAALDEVAGRVFSSAAMAERAERLLAAIQLEGRVSIPGATRELGISTVQLKALLYQADQSGRFTGYVDWAGGVIYSRDAGALRDGARCPSCAGELALAGKGLIRCGHCGAEIYL